MTYAAMMLSLAILYMCQILLDSVWLGWIMRDFYREQFSRVILGTPIIFTTSVALIVWLLMVIGHFLFVRQAVPGGFILTVGYGFLYGFVLFGVYQLTNYAIFPTWPKEIVIVDIGWGISANIILAAVTFMLVRHFN
jgi:uncharacterized membrane protein